MLLRSINHVGQATRNLDALTSFYAEVFDAPVERLGDGHAFIRVGDTTVLHAFERPDVMYTSDPAPWRHGPLDHLAFEARDVDAFGTARERLVARGAAAQEVNDFGSLVSVHFHDPDGMLHELALWKTPDWDPSFATTPFRGRAGQGALRAAR